jgi:Fe-Mn family superoxide dismutase
MMLHHDKHHASYIADLNSTLEPFAELHERGALWLLLNLSKVPQEIRNSVRNSAGGHVNHSIFWQTMSAGGHGAPTGPLATAIDRDFGGLEQFKVRFARAGNAMLGSGWVWLVKTRQNGGRLRIHVTSGHDNPMMHGHSPVLVNDVWEHAYYLKYENRRADYLQAWWSVVNWLEAGRRFERSDHSAEQRWEDEGGRILRVMK